MTSVEDTTCPICVEAYDDDARRPVPLDITCGNRICLLCLRNLLRQSCVPTAVTTAGDAEVEWGRLPAPPNCPFCRTVLDRSRLAQFPVEPALLDLAFGVDRSQAHYRYEGQDWQPYDDSSFGSAVSALPVLDVGLLAVAHQDSWFMPGTGGAVVELVTAYNAELGDIRSAVAATGEPSPVRAGEAITAFDGLTSHLFVICADRADVAGRFLAALPPTGGFWQGCLMNLEAMRAACLAVAEATEATLSTASELLEATPCVELTVPDLGAAQRVLGDTTRWFGTAARITQVNDALTEQWATVQALLDDWSLDEAKGLAEQMLREITRLQVDELISIMEDATGKCALILQESTYVMAAVAVIRRNLGLSELTRA
ncbi:hypothetical protein [Lentzea sp. E54]|uniref:hypothetical protein n=1 Tax=Lentzea xerophila TaxID=3435883 RepID=UPI003DA6751C